jgi:predicted transglutaminase-like cysteine proteinase
VGTSSHSIGGASRHASGFFRRPKGSAIAEWLPELIRLHHAAAVLAISENDLLELAKMPSTIDGAAILTPRAPQLDLVLDKMATSVAAKAAGIDVPYTWQPAAGEDFEEIAARIDYPLAIKWNEPMAVMPMLNAHNVAFEKIEYAGDAPALLAILAKYHPLQKWPLVQSYCPGVGIGQMLSMRGGRAALKFQHRRLHEWPPSGGVSTLCQNEPPECHAAQMAKSEALLRHIGWQGPAMVEYRYDAATGRYWLMEINGRFWGSLPLAHYCGAHFAWESYAHAVLGQRDDAAPPEYYPVKACYMIPETRRLVSILAARPGQYGWREKGAALSSFVRGRLDFRMRYYVFSFADPKPFFTDMIGIIARLLRRGK